MTRAAYLPFPPGSQPPYAVPAYGSTTRRAPLQPLVALAEAGPGTEPCIEHAGPTFTPARFPPAADLSKLDGRDALGERIIVAGRVTDEADRPVAHAMIELWQANAAGRYHHARDQHDAPLDPNFSGVGRVFTDGDGRYRFVTIKPGAYPWRNHANAWRPNHIHFSLFGASWGARLVTQMYFPGDPLLAIDPIFQSVPDAAARDRLVAAFDLALTQPEWALGYRFDLVLRGLHATPFEAGEHR
ncbi:MAG TPA: protocatechuate 3,4-dioxygenase subunit beta [Kofleriaceae bacterium]|nr:protocatechuate 3,4-dioxygenase subunit beta [Kofleriaceae bacterium]